MCCPPPAALFKQTNGTNGFQSKTHAGKTKALDAVNSANQRDTIRYVSYIDRGDMPGGARLEYPPYLYTISIDGIASSGSRIEITHTLACSLEISHCAQVQCSRPAEAGRMSAPLRAAVRLPAGWLAARQRRSCPFFRHPSPKSDLHNIAPLRTCEVEYLVFNTNSITK